MTNERTIKMELDPEKARQNKARRRYRLNVTQIPRLRVFGFALLLFLVPLHNIFILGVFSWTRFSLFASIMAAYLAVSWAVLYRYFERWKGIDLGAFFLGADIFIFVLAIYFSGGTESWLFFLLIVRVADQTNISFRRVVVFSHLSVIVYLLMLLYLGFIERKPFVWETESVKLLLVYCINLYISLTAKTAEKLREQTRTSIRIAREELKKRIKIEKDLKKGEQLLRSTLESSADGIILVDQGGIVTHMNEKFARMWRIPQDLTDMKDGKKLLNFVLDQLEDPDAFLEKVRQLFRSRENDLDTIFLKDGRVFNRLSYALIREGKIAGRVWNFRDITERKQREKQLKETLSRIQKYNELMMGREERVLELKAEVNALLADLGRERKYKTAALS